MGNQTFDPSALAAYAWVAYVVGAVIIAAGFWLLRGYRLFGIVYVPDNKMGIVSKGFKLVGKDKALPDGAIIALKGEAGIQADTLAPGLYFMYWPWQYSIDLIGFTVIPEGMVGVVRSKDGKPMDMGRVLAASVQCDRFQSARAFLTGGGQRGPQLDIIPPGTYRINTALFEVGMKDALQVQQNKVCIVTTLEGAPLPTGEIAGREVDGHNLFQNADAFVKAGGFKGLQTQVMLAGTYYINPLFIKTEFVDLTVVPIGQVGVVVAYVGEEGRDRTGAEFTHGNIVGKGQKGVWIEPLDPGRYPINPFTHKVELVPTTNIVLNWATGKSEAHKLDEKLSTIQVRSKDGFGFNLDVSQIVHVPREQAPKVIARFGSMANLVTQVLEPTIGNYFRNSAQGSTVLEFLSGRSQRQSEAGAHIKGALDKYNVQAVDTLIGDINPPDELMKTLTDRKVAEEMKTTFDMRRQAEEERQKFEMARSEADTRGQVVQAARSAEVAKLTADASINKAHGDAEAKKKIAEGEAYYTRTTGDADAAKTTAVGMAEAQVLKAKVESVGDRNYAAMQMLGDIAKGKPQIVPQVLVTSGGNGTGGGNVVEALLGMVLANQASAVSVAKPNGAASSEHRAS